MLFTFEDALQIHHAKCEKIEVYKLANPAEAWAGFGVTAICSTDDFTVMMSWWLLMLSTARLTKKNQQRPFRLAGQGFSGACNCKGRT